MENGFDQFPETTPTLTLEPELEEKPNLAVREETAVAAAPVNEPQLTEAERKMVNDFAAKIDVENTAQILQYGAGTQRKWRIFPTPRWQTSAPRIWGKWVN